jgi:hypothetical protein
MDQPTLLSPTELFRSTHLDEVEATVEVLKAAGIEHNLDAPDAEDGVAILGQIQKEQVAVVVLVAKDDLEAARAALEASFAESELPQGHFLLTATDADLAEILSAPDKWSAFDAAHARRLAGERGVDLTVAIADATKAAGRKLERIEGSPLLLLLAVAGVVVTAVMIGMGHRGLVASLGAIVGVLIGQHYGWAEQEDGGAPVYVDGSRTAGRWIVVTGVVIVLLPKLLG